MWYLEPELATKKEVEQTLDQIWRWECLNVMGWFGTEDRFEQAEALWAEYYS